MATKPRTGALPRRQVQRAQERADRTRELVIEETIKCIREEGFAAASTRHIIERAGVSTGVIQYHFGDRDGLLTAVIEHAITTLAESIDELADKVSGITDPDARMAELAAAAWEAFLNPASMTAMEILIATRSLRATLDVEQLTDLQPGLNRIAELIGDSSPHSTAIADLLWAAPVGLMVGQMVTSQPLPTEPQRHAMAQLMADHLRRYGASDSVSRRAKRTPNRAVNKGRSPARRRQPS
jgi:TetR/AcrR family transcriptional regulator, regulator of cefoperazone and chloramphenicol sensitivity